MDYEYGEYGRRGHVPAFGSWDWNDAVPFTQCFETATTHHHQQQQQAPYLHYPSYPQDRDLYMTGDLYNNHHVVAPAVILLPRRRAKVVQEPTEEKKRTKSKEQHNFETEAREVHVPTQVVKRRTKAPKPVDEDLYKVSPQLLSVKSKSKRGDGFGCFSCFLPTRVL